MILSNIGFDIEEKYTFSKNSTPDYKVYYLESNKRSVTAIMHHMGVYICVHKIRSNKHCISVCRIVSSKQKQSRIYVILLIVAMISYLHLL